MSAYSSVKGVYDKASHPLTLGGWLLLPFFGASANAATAANPAATTMDVAHSFYGNVLKDPTGAVTGIGKFATIAANDTAALGTKALAMANVSTVSSVFAFATGAAVVAVGLWGLYKVSSAIFDAKPG